MSNPFHTKLSNNVRRLYNCRHSCFVNVMQSVSSKFTRFKCTLKIVAKFNYVCSIQSCDPEQICISGLRSVRFLCLFIKPCNHSIPAILLSNQLLGNLHSRLFAIIACQLTELFICHSVIQLGTFNYVDH